jgi:hypothetical protein
MHNDFKPVHLQKANAKLDRHVLLSERYQQYDDAHKDISLWKKFLGLFKTSPFELPEELYKNK